MPWKPLQIFVTIYISNSIIYTEHWEQRAVSVFSAHFNMLQCLPFLIVDWRKKKKEEKRFSHAEISPVNYLKNVHDATKWRVLLLTRYYSAQVVSLCEEAVLDVSYALRRQTVFAQVIPAWENDKQIWIFLSTRVKVCHLQCCTEQW